jgi:tetratricopeptide (TPR) repeat protein
MDLGGDHAIGHRATRGVDVGDQVRPQAIAMGTGVFQALCHLSLGEAQMLAGRLEEAHTLADHALALARMHQERGNEAYALHLLGEMAARCEPPEAAPAEDHFRQAIALAQELGMQPLQAHCHLGLGTLYVKTGQREQARAALAISIELYRPISHDLMAAAGCVDAGAGGSEMTMEEGHQVSLVTFGPKMSHRSTTNAEERCSV